MIITEVQGMESDVITLQDLYRFEVEGVAAQRSVVGQLQATGLRPTFLHKFERRGIQLPPGFVAPTLRSAATPAGRRS
jgi:pilus assembly protein CpaF